MSKPKNNTLVVDFIKKGDYSNKLIYIKSLDCFFHLINNKYYRPLETLSLRATLWTYLDSFWPEVCIRESLIADLIKQLPLALQNNWRNDLADQYIAFADCLFNTQTLETEDFNKDKIATIYFSFNYQDTKNSITPIFDKFLEKILVEEDDTTKPDKSLVTFIQEMFGYLLVPQMHAAAAFFLYGNGSNGKSTLTNLLRSFFGVENVSSYSIENLTTRPFTVAGLIGKRVNICNEDESKFVRSDKFKAIVSGELVSAERKFGNSFEFCPTTKFLFCTNKMPTFEGADYGLRRRVKIIPFYQTISDAEKDVFMLEKLKAEIPGILFWAIEGLKRLKKNNYVFSVNGSIALEKITKEFVAENSSAIQFVEEFYEIDADSFISNQSMYALYKDWCNENTRKPMRSNKFHKEICSVLLIKSSLKNEDGLVIRGKPMRKRTDAPILIDSIQFPAGKKEQAVLDDMDKIAF